MQRLAPLAAPAALALALAFATTAPAGAATYTLRTDGTGDFPTIAAALAAVVDGDEVVLEPGVYLEHGLELTKSITLRSQNGDAGTTAIDAESQGGILTVLEARELSVEYLGFRNGRRQIGAGILFGIAGGTVRGCVFSDGAAEVDGSDWGLGGAVYAEISELSFEYCTFRGTKSGGAVHVEDQFWPAGLGRVRLDHCLFVDNVGGAVVSFSDDFITITGCTIVGTTGPAASGAGPFRLENTIIANSVGGPALEPRCPLDAILSSAICCNFYGNEGGDYLECLSDWLGEDGNISADPLFCDAASGNYTLASDSPCAITVSPCGQIGALGVACGSTTVDSESFARIKAAWRTRTPGRD